MRKTILTLVTLILSSFSAWAVDDSTVEIVFNGESATVTAADNIASYVSSAVNGAYVTIVQDSTAGANTSGEIIYSLSGSSSNGSLYLDGSYKCTVILAGLDLTCTTGPAINIQNGKRVNVSVKSGTENTLTDVAGGDWKGCFVCKGHPEFKGKGSLTVNGKTAHGIWAKEYVEVKNCTINIPSAVKDGINCNQYFLMESGTINITSPGDDGIQVSFKDDPQTDVEDTGNFTMKDGTLSITGHGGVCIKADGSITFSGGTQDFNTSDIKEYASTTGIQSVQQNQQTNDAIYDLSGRQISKGQPLNKGIYIQNGQKIIK